MNQYLKSHNVKQEPKHIGLGMENLYGFVLTNFLTTGGFKWIDPKGFDSKKYSSNSSKSCFLEVIFNILKNYRNGTMIILNPQIKLISKKKCSNVN